MGDLSKIIEIAVIKSSRLDTAELIVDTFHKCINGFLGALARKKPPALLVE